MAENSARISYRQFMTTDNNNGKKGANLKQRARVFLAQNLNTLPCHIFTEVLPLWITSYFFT